MTQLELKQSSTLKFPVNVTDSSGEVVTMDDWEFHFTAKRSINDTDVDAVIHKTSTDGITITDEDTGEIQIEIAPDDTDSLEDTPLNLIWDIVAVVDDEELPIAEGKLLITKRVKHDE